MNVLAQARLSKAPERACDRGEVAIKGPFNRRASYRSANGSDEQAIGTFRILSDA
jgi:hypothetical protein